MTNRERLDGMLFKEFDNDAERIVDFLLNDILTNQQVGELIQEIKSGNKLNQEV